jgi:FlaA1/EpsC-like NDP-sugar epimerase
MRNRYLFLLDLPAIAVAAYGAFVLRFDWLFAQHRPGFLLYVAAAAAIKPLVFYGFGIYARYWQYASVADMTAIFLAVSTSSVIMALVVGLERWIVVSSEFPRSVVFIDWLLTLVLIGVIRASMRVISDQRSRNQKNSASADQTRPDRRVLIVGAGSAGSMVAREMHQNPHLRMTPVGYLDDDRAKVGKRIHGRVVLGDTSSLAEVVVSHRVDEVVIAMPRAPGAAVRAVADECRRHGVTSRIVPGVFELLDGHVSINRLRKVEISDLLRRPQVVGSAEQLSYLEGHTVLITGAGGSIGGDLSRQVAFSKPKQLVLLGHGENSIFVVHASLREQFPNVRLQPVIADMRDPARLDTVFGRFKPDVVFHAAAHKHVPLMEVNPEEAFTNNVRGTQNALQASERHGVRRFVLISTDKAVAPTSVMGASKRLAESLVISAGRRSNQPYAVVRFGNVLGSRGSVVPLLQAQIERGGPVTITHPDMRRFFMTIPEAVQLVLHAGGMGTAGDLFVLNMGEQVRVLDLANDLIRLSGVEPASISIEFSGVRPGEKLQETLWETGATVELTSNPDVFRVREQDLQPGPDIQPMIEDVMAAAESGDRDRLRVSLMLAVPSYVRAAAVPFGGSDGRGSSLPSANPSE